MIPFVRMVATAGLLWWMSTGSMTALILTFTLQCLAIEFLASRQELAWRAVKMLVREGLDDDREKETR